jgi:uncharacterized membrane-anchored protein
LGVRAFFKRPGFVLGVQIAVVSVCFGGGFVLIIYSRFQARREGERAWKEFEQHNPL